MLRASPWDVRPAAKGMSAASASGVPLAGFLRKVKVCLLGGSCESSSHAAMRKEAIRNNGGKAVFNVKQRDTTHFLCPPDAWAADLRRQIIDQGGVVPAAAVFVRASWLDDCLRLRRRAPTVRAQCRHLSHISTCSCARASPSPPRNTNDGYAAHASGCGTNPLHKSGHLLPEQRSAEEAEAGADNDVWKPPFLRPICQMRCGFSDHCNANKDLTDVLENLALYYKITP